MPMLPKRTKFRKQQRGKLRGNATRGNYVAYGDYGLQSLEPHWLTARQIESGRIAAQHFLRRQKAGSAGPAIDLAPASSHVHSVLLGQVIRHAVGQRSDSMLR